MKELPNALYGSAMTAMEVFRPSSKLSVFVRLNYANNYQII